MSLGSKFFCAAIMFLTPMVSMAEPTTEPLNILRIRPYNSESNGLASVYIYTDRKSLCDTDMYRIDLGWYGSKEMVSAAMAAMIAGKQVQLEIDNAGCASPSWSTKLQSIYVNN
ncbi:hypothetical protein ONV78_27325 [Hahella sp. CR1]|uniref:hypothetical protein n=1 Tax=Hahella sp. CR1 TaxID=2992807 RepID=UPI0024428780|nr:hypothetical protein [Hahella sp. CR1]MDG9671476.1 hypothetical protein [Hahella sp. CR1]